MESSEGITEAMSVEVSAKRPREEVSDDELGNTKRICLSKEVSENGIENGLENGKENGTENNIDTDELEKLSDAKKSKEDVDMEKNSKSLESIDNGEKVNVRVKS